MSGTAITLFSPLVSHTLDLTGGGDQEDFLYPISNQIQNDVTVLVTVMFVISTLACPLLATNCFWLPFCHTCVGYCVLYVDMHA